MGIENKVEGVKTSQEEYREFYQAKMSTKDSGRTYQIKEAEQKTEQYRNKKAF